MIKKVVNVLKRIEDFLYDICLVFSKGFYFYFFLLAKLLHKIFPLSVFEKIKFYFKRRQEDPSAFLFLVFVFLLCISVYVHFYDDNELKYVSYNVMDNNTVPNTPVTLDSTELNLYKRYAKIDLDSVSFSDLKKVNSQVISWITVDGTNINYPIVQTYDNDYYLNHDIENNLKSSGWTFMDYRNAVNLSDDNTIYYGHNLMNKTAFGSISNLFKKDWFLNSNHYIVVLNEEGRHIYEIFSVYTVKPEVYYLQNNFSNREDYKIFLDTLKSRSIYDFKIDLEKDDRIITLSTCTNDNKNRSVVHAKLIKE